MENLYFPLFLVVMAGLVIWLYQKTRNAGDRRAKQRKQKAARSGRRVSHTIATGAGTSDKMWSGRRQHARHDNDSELPPHTIHADYLGPYGKKGSDGKSAGRIGEQDVDELEYVGLDEYIAGEGVRPDTQESQEAKELTMKAVKYEPTDIAQDEESPKPRRAGFKP